SVSATRVLYWARAAGLSMVRAATCACRPGRFLMSASSVSMARFCGPDALFIVAPDIKAVRSAAASWLVARSIALRLAWLAGVGAARYSSASRRSAWIRPSKLPVGWPVAFFSVLARARLMAFLAEMLVAKTYRPNSDSRGTRARSRILLRTDRRGQVMGASMRSKTEL